MVIRRAVAAYSVLHNLRLPFTPAPVEQVLAMPVMSGMVPTGYIMVMSGETCNDRPREGTRGDVVRGARHGTEGFMEKIPLSRCVQVQALRCCPTHCSSHARPRQAAAGVTVTEYARLCNIAWNRTSRSCDMSEKIRLSTP